MDKIHEIKCAKCGEGASGPDLKAVQESMARHEKKAHPAKVVKSDTVKRR